MTNHLILRDIVDFMMVFDWFFYMFIHQRWVYEVSCCFKVPVYVLLELYKLPSSDMATLSKAN